ncbi:MAG: sucrase ferredoxin [Nitriliruptor sp.]|nr:MAG: sucrase ferredoxin [Nitriliruptor sp.]
MSSSTCSTLARAHHEPLAGTASQASGYLLIEQPGSWGRHALTESALAADLGARLEDAGEAAGVKVLLTRRPGPHAGVELARREVVLAHTGPTPWMEVCQLTPSELAALDPAACAAPVPPGLGTTVTRPRWLVCTHAKRDRCCASLGRPVADTLGALHAEETWETSHLGGHRFAATMLVLPEGLVYGDLDVATAMEVVTGHLAGRVSLDHLRGRSHLSPLAQVAEVAARSQLGVDRIDGVEVTDQPLQGPEPDGGPVQVAVAAGGRQVQVSIRARRDRRPRPMSCDTEPEIPVLLEVLDLEVVG